jgi:hypothetical protein
MNDEPGRIKEEAVMVCLNVLSCRWDKAVMVCFKVLSVHLSGNTEKTLEKPQLG